MCDIKRLLIGKLTKPRGLKGEIRMHYYGNDPDDLKDISSARLVTSQSSELDLEIEAVKGAKKRLIVKFKGIDTIDDAENLLGSLVHINKAELKRPEVNEYYYDDLIGMAVYDEADKLIGRVEGVLETGSNDVYVVKHDGKELLIPAIEDVIKVVDVENKTMRVRLLKGMRDEF